MYPVAGPNRDWLLSAMDTYRRTAIVLRYWCDMTIAMAAFAGPSKIVTVSDARLSYNEMVPAEDAATMKSRQIARKWGLMFAAEDSTAFTPLVEKAVPEWRSTLDALLLLPEIGSAVGYSGWTAVGIHLAAVEPRIAAAVLFAGGYVPRAQREEARQLTIPLQFLLQWDDEGNPRQRALDLFDAFGSKEKTLHANLGGHVGTPWFEVENGARFFARHLR